MYSYKIEQGIRAAALLHGVQNRKGKIPLPYITHLAAVAWIVNDYTDDEDTIVSAWLHDTLENTDYTKAELEEDFGREVLKIVVTLTEPKEEGGRNLSWSERKVAYNEQLKTGPEAALIIAAADKIHNMRSVVEEYHDNLRAFLKDFPEDLEERMLHYQNISNTLNRRLTNDIIAEFNHVYSEYKNFLGYVSKISSVK